MRIRNFSTLLIILSFFFGSCNQENESSEYKDKWISTSNFSWSTPGTFLDLSGKDSLFETRYFNSKYLKAHKYHIDELNNIFLDDTLFYGKIIKHTENILIIKDSFETNSFIPIKNYNLKVDTNEIKKILLAYDWQLSDEAFSLRLEFTNNSWTINPQLFLYLRINESKGWEYYDTELWTITNYKNSYFIVLSHSHGNYQFYQIKSISDSTIIAETCWRDSVVEAVFSIQKRLDANSYKKLKEKIIGNWNLIDYMELADSSRMDIIPITRTKGRNRPFADEDSVPLILNNYYLKKSINYQFLSDGSCLMKSNDKILRTADWTLSDDGKYIKTSNGWLNAMKVNFVSDSIMVIEKRQTIEYLDNSPLKEKFLQEKLKK